MARVRVSVRFARLAEIVRLACAAFSIAWPWPPFAPAWLAAAAGGCLQVSTGTGTGPGAGGSGPAAAETGDSGNGGTNCDQEPRSGAILCEQIDACPGVVVDPGLFPGCGFTLHGGGTLDLECVCGDALCPIGVPQTCAQATQLLTSQSVLLVCEQASEGRCIPLAGTDAGAGSSSDCLAQCRSDCAGVASCMQLCGC